MAGPVVFLALGCQLGYVTGSVLIADGGWTTIDGEILSATVGSGCSLKAGYLDSANCKFAGPLLDGRGSER